jgi:hypothetical protein
MLPPPSSFTLFVHVTEPPEAVGVTATRAPAFSIEHWTTIKSSTDTEAIALVVKEAGELE